jgi:hypothetical protein
VEEPDAARMQHLADALLVQHGGGCSAVDIITSGTATARL